MAKYYVTSGELKRIVTANNALEACDKALLQARGETIGDFFHVDERGFRNGQYEKDQPNISPTLSIQRKFIFQTQGQDEVETDKYFEEDDLNNPDEDWLDDADFDS